MRKYAYILWIVPLAFVFTHIIGLAYSFLGFDLIKEYIPLKDLWHNDILTFYAATGYGQISFFFIAFGCVFILTATKGLKSTPSKVRMTRFIGLSFLFCGLLRCLEFVAIWNNYAVITVILSNVTGLVACAAIVMLPTVLKETKEQRRLEDVERKLHEARAALQKTALLVAEIDKPKKDEL